MKKISRVVSTIAMLALLAGALAPGAAAPQLIYTGGVFVTGAGLLVAGALAMVGRRDYKAWRHSQNAQVSDGPAGLVLDD